MYITTHKKHTKTQITTKDKMVFPRHHNTSLKNPNIIK